MSFLSVTSPDGHLPRQERQEDVKVHKTTDTNAPSTEAPAAALLSAAVSAASTAGQQEEAVAQLTVEELEDLRQRRERY